MEYPGELRVVEAKSGQTFSGDMLDPVERVRARLAELGTSRAYLGFGGDRAQTRDAARILPWHQVEELDRPPPVPDAGGP